MGIYLPTITCLIDNKDVPTSTLETWHDVANKENAEKLLALDYSDCLSEEERNRPQVIAKMKALVKQSNSPNLDVDKGEVGLSDYKDTTSKYKEVYEQGYQISWLQLDRK